MKSIMFLTVLLFLTGCGQFVPPQPAAKQMVEVKLTWDGEGKIKLDGDAKIDVDNQRPRAANEQCGCGCEKFGCDCPTNLPSASFKSVAANQKPIVELLTDFDDGRCAACDLAWQDWQTNGGSWPFRLVKVRGNRLGGTSPTFRFTASGRVWRPATYSLGDLSREYSR